MNATQLIYYHMTYLHMPFCPARLANLSPMIGFLCMRGQAFKTPQYGHYCQLNIYPQFDEGSLQRLVARFTAQNLHLKSHQDYSSVVEVKVVTAWEPTNQQ